MLVTDLKFDKERIADHIKQCMGRHPDIPKQDFEDVVLHEAHPSGVLLCYLNFVNHLEYSTSFQLKGGNRFTHYADVQVPYGVVDTPEQIIANVPELLDPDRLFIALATPISADTQPESGGWRWHKWGPYLGVGNPTCEYIHDEPVLRDVHVFSIYELEIVEK